MGQRPEFVIDYGVPPIVYPYAPEDIISKPGKLLLDRTFASTKGSNYPSVPMLKDSAEKVPRTEERDQHIRLLGIEQDSHSGFELPPDDLNLRLLELVDRAQSERHCVFSRFERLALFNLHRLQHKLMVLDETFQHDPKSISTIQPPLHDMLETYCKCIIKHLIALY